VELYFHSPNTLSWHGAQLKTQGQLYLYIKNLIVKFIMFPHHNIHKYTWANKGKGKGKGKVVPVLNQAPRHEGILEEWWYSSTHP
jgi:hypothetical protein